MVLRAVFALTLGLADDETYHWTWTKDLALSYFDHPGMIAWIVGLSTKIFGDTILGVRLPAFLLYLGACIFTFKLSRDLFDEKVAAIAVALMLFTPLWGFGGFVSAPELPFFFLWTCAAWVFWQGVRPDERRWSLPRTWLTLGVLVGLGLNAKFPMIFLAPGFCLYLLCSKDRRKDLLTPWPWIGLGIALLLCAPIILWNIQYDWPGFKYQFHERHTGGGGPSLSRWLGWWGYQFLFMSPIVYLLLLVTLAKGLRRSAEAPWRFVFCLAIPLFLIFYPQPIFADYKPHWSGPAYWILSLGVGALWFEGLSVGKRTWIRARSRTIMAAAVFFLALLTVISYAPFMSPILPKLHKAFTPNVVWKPKYDFSNEFFGWPEFGAWALDMQNEIERQTGERPIFGASRYEITSQTWYATKQKTWMLSKTRSHFTVTQTPAEIEALKGKRVLFVSNDKYEIDPQHYASFDSCEKKSFEFFRGETLARTFHIHDCKNFQGILR